MSELQNSDDVQRMSRPNQEAVRDPDVDPDPTVEPEPTPVEPSPADPPTPDEPAEPVPDDDA